MFFKTNTLVLKLPLSDLRSQRLNPGFEDGKFDQTSGQFEESRGKAATSEQRKIFKGSFLHLFSLLHFCLDRTCTSQPTKP